MNEFIYSSITRFMYSIITVLSYYSHHINIRVTLVADLEQEYIESGLIIYPTM